MGILTKTNLKTKVLAHSPFTSFEHMEASIATCKTHVHLLVIYHPPPSKNNGLSVGMFLTEFATFLESVIIAPGHLLIVGDFNPHVDDPNDTSARKFFQILDANNLVQHIIVPTHVSGHTLDLVISRATDPIVLDHLTINPCISDHEVVVFNLHLTKQPNVTKTIKYRPLAKINHDEFNDLKESILICNPPSDLTMLVSLYHTEQFA